MKKSLVFFGTEDFSAASLKRLVKDGWGFSAVVTKPDFKKGRGQTIVEPQVKTLARENGITVLQPYDLHEVAESLKKLGSEYAVLVSYGKIVPQAILDLFPGGIVNLHPSLLPKYRGPAPIEAAILNGDDKTGISLMKLTADMDAGPVYAQEEVSLDGNETQSYLYKELAERGAAFLAAKLEDIVNSSLLAIPQNEAQASYTSLISKDDGWLDTSNSATELERQVRAYERWPRCRLNLSSHEVIVTKARLANSVEDGGLIIECSPGYLEIERLIIPGGKEISGPDYIKGYSR